MKFDLGDRVIYPHHGAALITAREKRKAFGEEREYLIHYSVPSTRIPKNPCSQSCPAWRCRSFGV